MSDRRPMSGTDLAQALEVLGWSQAELGRRLEKRPATVTEWVNRVNGPIPGYVSGYIDLALAAAGLASKVNPGA